MLALTGVTPAQLQASHPEITLGEARKLLAMVYRGEPLRAGSAVRRRAVEALAAWQVPALDVRQTCASAVDPFVKYVIEAEAGMSFETVRIPLEKPGRYTACVSSQVGCAMACSFCATGRLGLRRNLATWEIIEQIRIIRARLPAGGRVHGVVFQGMGEPLANLDAVLGAIAICAEPSTLGIDARAITVCTSGLPSGILRMAREAPKVRMAWSVGSARDAVRRRLLPVAERFAQAEVLAALVEHARLTGHAPMWAVTLLAGENDTVEDAAALAQLARAFEAQTGLRPRLSLVAYNAIGGDDPYQRSTPAQEAAFRGVLAAQGLAHHRRYSGGGDVGAACGQLVAELAPRAARPSPGADST